MKIDKEEAHKKPSGSRKSRKKSIQMYDREDNRYKKITKVLALFVGGTAIPNSIGENEHFRYLVQCLNPLHPIPGQNSLSNEINVAYKNMKAQVELFLIEACAISLCADIWTKRGLSSSYLGVTAQFFSLKDRKLHNVVLAVRSMSHPHTGDAIKSLVEDIVAEWEIPIDKIQTITTDNGSNMIKAFRDSEKVSEDDELCIEEGFDVMSLMTFMILRLGKMSIKCHLL